LMIQADKLKSKEKLATLIEKQGWDKKKRMYLLKAANFLNAQLMMRSLAWNLSDEKIAKEGLEEFSTNIFFEIIVQYILKKQTNNSSKIKEIFDEDVLKDLAGKKIIDKITEKMFDKKKFTKEKIKTKKELVGEPAMFIPVYKDKKFVRLSRPFVISKAIKNFATYNLLASGADDNTIKLWDVYADKAITTMEHKDPVKSVAFSSDGKVFASVSEKTITLWDMTNPKKPNRIKTLNGDYGYHEIMFSRDDKKIISNYKGSQLVDPIIEVWDIEKNEKSKSFEDYQALCFSQDGKKIYLAKYGGEIEIWDVKKNEKEKDSLSYISGLALKIKFSSNGKRIAYLNDYLKEEQKIYQVAFRDIEKNGKKTKYLNEKEVALSYFSFINNSSFNLDGSKIASGFSNGIITFTDVVNKEPIIILKGHNGEVNSVAFSPDSDILASGSKDKTIKLWNVKTGKEIKTLTEHKGIVNSVAFSPVMLEEILDK